MSALADHPNALEARDLRRHEIEHAMRCLYRDNTWIDPDGSLEVLAWLRRVHYLRPGTEVGWLRAARIDPLTPVGDLSVHDRERLVWQMLRFLKLQVVGSDADPAREVRQIIARPPAATPPAAGHLHPERFPLTSSSPTPGVCGTRYSAAHRRGEEGTR